MESAPTTRISALTKIDTAGSSVLGGIGNPIYWGIPRGRSHCWFPALIFDQDFGVDGRSH